MEGCSKSRKKNKSWGKECSCLHSDLNIRCSCAYYFLQYGSCHQQKDEFFNKSLANAFLRSSPDKKNNHLLKQNREKFLKNQLSSFTDFFSLT